MTEDDRFAYTTWSDKRGYLSATRCPAGRKQTRSVTRMSQRYTRYSLWSLPVARAHSALRITRWPSIDLHASIMESFNLFRMSTQTGMVFVMTTARGTPHNGSDDMYCFLLWSNCGCRASSSYLCEIKSSNALIRLYKTRTFFICSCFNGWFIFSGHANA